MRTRKTGRGLRRAFAAVTTVAALGCGTSPLTSARIEGAIAPTFANLVQLQLSRVGLSPVTASDITVTASCRKTVPNSGEVGAGEWVCALLWYGPNRRALRDTYDVSVGTDGCYTASIEGADENLGGPISTTAEGSVRNLLYAFEGCFDTT